ncbi:MAG: enoyl-CoA hydratase/isomerase family protein [Planctomycetota bacterium]
MSQKLVRYEIHEKIAVLTLSDPPANAYTHEMMLALDEAILKARFDTEVEVIVVTGDGDKFFCAGADIQMLQEVDPAFKYYFCLHANETLSRLEQTPKLTIAALNGHCVGGGLEIALACDLRWAKEHGGKCGLPEVHLGVLPGTGGTQRLLRLVGRSKALKLMISGDNMNFAAAKEAGLIDDLIDCGVGSGDEGNGGTETQGADHRAGFLDRVLERAQQFVSPQKASKAVGLIKRACVSGSEMAFEPSLAFERELQQQLFQSHDAKEGMLAFNEKRRPEFRGE